MHSCLVVRLGFVHIASAPRVRFRYSVRAQGGEGKGGACARLLYTAHTLVCLEAGCAVLLPVIGRVFASLGCARQGQCRPGARRYARGGPLSDTMRYDMVFARLCSSFGGYLLPPLASCKRDDHDGGELSSSEYLDGWRRLCSCSQLLSAHRPRCSHVAPRDSILTPWGTRSYLREHL